MPWHLASDSIITSPFGEQTQILAIKKALLFWTQNRSAFFIANICVCSPNGEVIIESEAKCYGKIILNQRGKGGFGYDPIFEESSTRLTFAEMNNNIKDSCSHRGKALNKIIPDLIEIFSWIQLTQDPWRPWGIEMGNS